MIKQEILKNSGLNEEISEENQQKVKQAILAFTSMFSENETFSAEQVKSKIGANFPTEDIHNVIADMIIDGYLRGTSNSFSITDKGRSQVEIKKPEKRKKKSSTGPPGKRVVDNMEMHDLMMLAAAMESENWDNIKNPSSYDLTRFKAIVDEEGISKEYPIISLFKKRDWVYFFKTAFSHL